MKPPKLFPEQLELLKKRGMLFKDESFALQFLSNVSYYRLKGYWWDLQVDTVNHKFKPDTYFEDVVNKYNFDRHLKLILFDAIERIEIALRTKMIYHLSLGHGALWYEADKLFTNQQRHSNHLQKLLKEFDYSQEVFIKEHKRNHANAKPEAWKIMEIASMGTLSKFYKNLKHQLPEKAKIAKGMGLEKHNELSSWLEAIVYVRNIIAHHSRLWSRNMVRTPKADISNPRAWFDSPLEEVQKKKVFLIISSMIYLCNHVTPNHHIKDKIKKLIANNPDIPIYKIGFLNDWEEQPIWK